jgi:transcriptional regulator with XRE-family HTH domain
MITKLKIAIDSSGFKQQFIAARLGINATLLSHYVRGQRRTPKKVLQSIAKILGCKSKDIA